MLDVLKKSPVLINDVLSFRTADSSTSFIVNDFTACGAGAATDEGLRWICSCCAIVENAVTLDEAEEDTSFTGRVLVGVVRVDEMCATDVGTGFGMSAGLPPRDRKLEEASMTRCIRKDRASPTCSGGCTLSAVDSAIRFLASFISTLALLRRITINTITAAIIKIVNTPDNITMYSKDFQNSCI
jgi:hypothetical protein